MQPENAEFFLSRENNGFPQRFLWLPTHDPYAPRDRPEPIPPRDVELPRFTLKEGGQWVEVPIPSAAVDEIWEHRHRVLLGAADVDPLDAHIMLTRLKVAAAIAILHGHPEVTGDAWAIAGQLIDISGQVRASLADAVAARRRRENAAKAHGQADREVIVRERLAEDSQQRVRDAIENRLKRVGAAARYELYQACDSSLRDDFESVFDRCLDEKFIVRCEEEGDGRAARYRLA